MYAPLATINKIVIPKLLFNIRDQLSSKSGSTAVVDQSSTKGVLGDQSVIKTCFDSNLNPCIWYNIIGESCYEGTSGTFQF